MQVIIQGKHGLRRVDLNRKRAVFEHCLNCSSWSHSEVENCRHGECLLHPFRSGKGKHDTHQRRKAIREYCLWCSGTAKEVKRCPCTTCSLWPYRNTCIDRTVEVTSFSENGQIQQGKIQASEEAV